MTLTGPGMTDPDAARDAVSYETSIFAEDLDLQEKALSGLEFPLDPGAELHTRADRVAVEFRRVLAEAVKSSLWDDRAFVGCLVEEFGGDADPG
jgi:hypothetical protein